MASVKLLKFLGEAPRIASELLPDGAAQTAYNTKLYSGDLMPYAKPCVDSTVGRTGQIKTIFPLTDPSDNSVKWLSWATDVDVIRASLGDVFINDEQRFYYTGDGAPKVSTFALATAGSAPYPNDGGYYQLGLPLPSVKPTTSVAAFSTLTTASFARDAANTATVITTAPHGLKSGNIVSIHSFTGTAPETFNATNTTITVINSTTFSYFNTGDTVTTTADTNGRVDLAGTTQTRNYLYTWITPWDEESIGSSPSEADFIKEGQAVTLTNLPQTKPAEPTYNFIRGLRVYRTIPTASGTAYYKIKDLWFPVSVASVARASNTATLVFSDDHNFNIGDRIKVAGCTDTSFNVTDAVIVSVPSPTSITYANNGSDKVTTADTSGKGYHDVAETLTDTARYWGDPSLGNPFYFVDDFLYSNLNTILASSDNDAPPDNMQGLSLAANGIYVGFFGNQICFSLPFKPYAWPIKYRLTAEYNIVAIAVSSGFILVLTEEYAYQITGSTPENMDISRIDTPYPCLSAASVVNMGFGVMYSTYAGLAVYNPASGLSLVTKFVHDWDTWGSALNPATIVGAYYNGKYFGSHSGGSFIFEQDEQIGGYFTKIDYKFTAAYTEPHSNRFYFVSGDQGTLYEWDKITEPLAPLEWRSKVLTLKDYLNFGAARVIADYTPTAQSTTNLIAANDAVPTTNATVWTQNTQLATINGPTWNSNNNSVAELGTLNSAPLNEDNIAAYLQVIPTALPVTFRLWVNKVLTYESTITSDAIFRLPTGYRSDTFEVGVTGSARIRSIHLGETPYGLRAS